MHNKLSFATIVLACMAMFGSSGCSNRTQSVPSDRAGAWLDIRGTHESFPFRVENGKGFEYEGEKYDDPCTPIITRADWVVIREGRTFVLYEVDPGNLEPNGFYRQFYESLWCGLVDDEGNVVRKTKLATGVKDISGIQGRGDAFVSATTTTGERTNIILRFPEPWPPLEPTGDAWLDFVQREERKVEELWEDWPDNGSGMAADWVSLRLEAWLSEEYSRAMAGAEALASDEDAARQVREGWNTALALLAECNAEDEEPANVHWGNFCDREDRARYLKPFLQNWLEAADHPAGWETVRNAHGTFLGEEFHATNGIAILDGPQGPSRCHRILRLSPAQVREEEGETLVGFDLIAPWVMDSGWLAGTGDLRIAHNGELREKRVELD